MIAGAKWGLIVVGLIFAAIGRFGATPADQVFGAMAFLTTVICIVGAVIMRGLQELWERKP